jgi:hypothetical protein
MKKVLVGRDRTKEGVRFCNHTFNSREGKEESGIAIIQSKNSTPRNSSHEGNTIGIIYITNVLLQNLPPICECKDSKSL